jgi:hypothetical protein
LRDIGLVGAGAGGLGLYAISGAAPAGFAACGILAAIAIYSALSAMKLGGLKPGFASAGELS